MDKVLTLEEADNKVALIELKEHAAILVVEWIAIQRGRQDEFDGFREELSNRMSQSRLRAALTEWFDPEKIRTRNAYKRTSG
jgi:hypothetical protein